MDPMNGMHVGYTAATSPARTQLLGDDIDHEDPTIYYAEGATKVVTGPAAYVSYEDQQQLFMTQTNTPSYCAGGAPLNGFGNQAMLGGNGGLGDEQSCFAKGPENGHMMMDECDQMSEAVCPERFTQLDEPVQVEEQ